MKKVKFNDNASVLMRSDKARDALVAKLEELKDTDYKKYRERLAGGPDEEFREVKEGEIVTVSNWYYEAHKDEYRNISNTNDKFKYKNSDVRRPFDQQDAEDLGLLQSSGFKRRIKLFDLIEDLDKSEKKSKAGE